MTSKYLSRQYDPIIPEVIGICEDLRNKAGIIWCFQDNEWKPLSHSCNNFTHK